MLDTQAAGTVDWQGRSPLALSASCNQLSCTVRLLEARKMRGTEDERISQHPPWHKQILIGKTWL